MFEEVCSIYSDALDNVGRYVDTETGECIQQMSVRDFCLTDRWKPHVERLRALRKEYGAAAKKMPEYANTKKMLPGATLSGLFATWPDECVRKDGTKFTAPVSRRESHLQRHTGWLAIDIDLADNNQLSDFENVRMVCRFRPEIALLMRSCSGAGYFGLVRLAYPDRHKEQFKALIREYAALGITLDKQCGNIGRVRFASWDDPEHIYINERACEYRGVEAPTVLPMGSALSEWHGAGYPTADRLGSQSNGRTFRDDTPREIYLKAQYLVNKIEARGVNILEDYDAWVRCGMALYHVSSTDGYGMWQRVSRFRPADAGHGHKEIDFRQRWASFVRYNVNAGTFFKMCKDFGVTLTKEDLREIYRQQ